MRRTAALSAGLTASLLLFTNLLNPPAAEAKKRRVRSSAPASQAPSSGSGVRLSTPNPRNPLEHNNRGVELGSKGLWPDAIREHEAALNGDPYNQTFRRNLSAAHLRYANILANKRKFYEAIHHFREALYADPNNEPASHGLDQCLEATGTNPTDYDARVGLADKAEVSGDYVTAIVEARRCVFMRDNGQSHYRLARVLYKQGESKVVESYEELRKAVIAEWPKDKAKELSQCHSLMGEILWSVANAAKNQGRGKVFFKRLSNAALCYKRAATINPANSEAIQGLINCCREAVAIKDDFENNLMMAGAYQLAGDFDRAKTVYEKCWRLRPKSSVLYKARRSYHLAVVSSALSSPAAVASSVLKIEKELEKNPDDPELLYIYGRGKEHLKETDLALRAYQKALAINPYINPDLSQGIARLTGSNPLGEGEEGSEKTASSDTGEGKSDASTGGEGVEKGDEKKKKVATKPKGLNPVVYERINNKTIAGDTEGALKDLSDLIDKHPDDGKAWMMQGTLQEQQGQMAEAKVSYRQAKAFKAEGAAAALRQIDSSRVKPLMDKATSELAEENLVKAAATLKQAIQLAPELPEPHRKLQDVLKKLGDAESSEKERKRADELEKET